MTNLAFNAHISSILKIKYSFALAALPILFMISSIGLLVLIDGLAGINIESLFDQHRNSHFLFAGFMLVMITLSYLGYLFGWLVNALISIIVFKWSKQQVKDVYLHSRVPEAWLKGGLSLAEATSNKMESWQQERKQGVTKFIFKIGIMRWGLFMFFVMSLIPALRSDQPIELMSLLPDAGIWTVAGVVFGYAMWFMLERQHSKFLAQ